MTSHRRKREPTPLGAYVRARRDELGLTQEALAERAGLSSTYIAMLERGEKRNPKRSTLRQLSEALEVEEATLLSPPAPPRPGGALERFLASGLAGEVTPEEIAKLQQMERILGPEPTQGTYLRALDLIRSAKQSQS